MAAVPKDKEVFLAIDANAIIHRAYHAYPDSLSNSQGLQLNAVYGFTSMLLSVLAEFDPKYIVCAFDTAKPTFRHTEFPDYKAHRKPTDQSLIDQFPLVEQIVEAFNIPILKKPGFEADDVLGDLSKKVKTGKWRDYDINMVIVSGDKDLLQLVGENVQVCLPIGNFRNLQVYDKQATYEKMGVYPEQIIDYKAIVGDPSDNIPGIKGVGVKSAETLLNKYGDINGIYENLSQLSVRQANLFKEGVEQMEMSRSLATIVDDVGVEVGLEQCVMTDFDRSKVLELFQNFQFRSLISKLPKQPQNDQTTAGQIDLFSTGESESSEKGQVDTKVDEIPAQSLNDIPPEAYVSFFNSLKKSSKVHMFYLRVEQFMSIGNSPYGKLVVGIVDNLGQLQLTPVELSGENSNLITKGFTKVSKCETSFFGWEDFTEDLVDLGGVVVLDDIKVFDIQLAGHILSSADRSGEFSNLVYKYLGVEAEKIQSIEQIYESFITFIKLSDAMREEFEQRKLSEYCISKLPKISQKSDFQELFYNYEIKLSQVLAKMENRGVGVDVKKLEDLTVNLKEVVEKAQNEVFSAVGHEFNLNSPKQLAEVLYDEIGMPSGRGKTGRTTKEDRLKKLQGLHPAIPYILEYRELSKLLNTYVTPLKDLITIDQQISQKEDFSVHTDYDQTGTSSGRLASRNPNMQNLPMKGDWSNQVREVFIPHRGYNFFSMDYSQVELRILADISQDKVLIRDFKQGKDIHTATASRILDKPLKGVTKKDRSLGKTINFGIVYGQTKYGLASMLDIPIDQASAYIDGYFETYTGVKEYLDGTSRRVRDKGFVETLLGRRRYIGGLESMNERVQSASLREAINMPIQGTAADIIKMAMVEIMDYLDSVGDDAFMLLQIHDELVFEIKEDRVDDISPKLREIFEDIVQFEVPLVVHTSVGENLSILK